MAPKPTGNRKRALEATIVTMAVEAAGRKSSHRNGYDPNDRAFRDWAKKLRRTNPLKLDSLLRDDEE